MPSTIAVVPRLLLVLVLTSACTNPFTTREPEPPETGGIPFLPPRTPEVVLQNMRNAILEQNVENYIRCLSDAARVARGFVFLPEPGVANENPGVFDNWSRESERNYFVQQRAFLPADSLRNLSLQTVQSSQFADSAQFVENYTLTLRHTQRDRGVPVIVGGQATFWLGVDDFGDWAIYRWEDRSNSDLPTWSVLKAAYGK